MRKSLSVSLAAVLSLSGASAIASERSPLPPLLQSCGGTFDLCGFRDRDTKALVIPQQFERVLPFGEGVAAVRINGSYGYIDESGKVVIEPRYDLAGRFYQGLAEVLVGDQTGVIDRQGRLVVRPQFAQSIALTKDVLLVREGKWRNSYIRGSEQLNNFTEGGTMLDSGWQLYHVRDGLIGKETFNLSLFEATGRGLVWAKTGSRSSGLFGLLRADGTWQIEPKFTQVQRIADEHAIVQRQAGSQTSWGAVDLDGKIVIPLQPRWLGPWLNGFGLIRDGIGEGLIDNAGNLLGARLFDKVERPEIGDVVRVMIDRKWHGIDRTGQILDQPPERAAKASCPSGIKLLERDNGFEVVDNAGKSTTTYVFDYAAHFSCNGPNAVRVGDALTGKWGILGTDGKLLSGTPSFDGIFEFADGHAIVQRDGKWGIIDASGRFTVEPSFDVLTPQGSRRSRDVGSGVYSAAGPAHYPEQGPLLYQGTRDGREVTISATGEEQQALSNRQTGGVDCRNGSRIFAAGGLFGYGQSWGLADKDGRVIIQPQYRALHCFENGIAWAPIDAKRKWCPVDPAGVVREQPACVKARHPYVEFHYNPERMDRDAYESSVLWSRAYLEFRSGQWRKPPRMVGDGGNGGTRIVDAR
jgi:hypothetical protein